ncbi:hypothetical protein NAL32_18940 [Chryseobacterium sp. Ch-15]|uniref:Uncharacterized protein n=1 Tax=Chryseobacterium muglaense TaxID=2893752 RepID=A0A9Q3V093_9FLAO|nr:MULTISPECIES: hypothetical protein [Chryseobacterium]MBD3906737.1 hypothetical protein [Chryseobacterium muglaense]MBO6184875.1 hypothetical protein [Chryseobacterium sp.]MCC9036599.1 hypothetical protein [Chryseobacterium muglaense]MCM2556469.1 hypothetical protein [Chryseobacterium muglaense]
MKNCIIFLLILCTQKFFSQKGNFNLESEIRLEKQVKFSKIIDSLIEVEPKQYSTLIADGSSIYSDKENKKLGEGGFTIYVMRSIMTKKIIKISKSSVMHVKENMKNSEGLKYEIYFDDNETPIFSKITENHYNTKEVLNSSLYFLSLPKDLKILDEIYYSNIESKQKLLEIFEIVNTYKTDRF